MDIYRFVNSRDMRDYLRKIDYGFSTLEAAFIVYWSNKVKLKEKVKAWVEIINTMPDCQIEKKRGGLQIDSFHSYLWEYIELQERNIRSFYSSDGHIYSYECHEVMDKTEALNVKNERDYDGWYGRSELFFSSYNSCIDYCKQKELVDDNVDKIRIFKYLLDQKADRGCINRPETILIDDKMDIIEIDVPQHEKKYDIDLESVFDEMCFDFPTPFKRGDILVDYKIQEEPWVQPFVLSHITTWDFKKMVCNGFKEDDHLLRQGPDKYDKRIENSLKNGDVSNMIAIGTYINDENLFLDHTLLIPIDLEYYHEPLKGYERQLKIFSSYEKGEIDGEILVNCCSEIRGEEHAKKANEYCMSIYEKESLKHIGMLPVG